MDASRLVKLVKKCVFNQELYSFGIRLLVEVDENRTTEDEAIDQFNEYKNDLQANVGL